MPDATDRRFFVAVKGILLSGGRFLILRRSGAARAEPGTWELPGGRLEFGESPREALERELREEVGIEPRVVRPVSTWTLIRRGRHQTVGITFLCRTDDLGVRLSPEHDASAWIAPEELATSPLPPHLSAELAALEWTAMR